MKIKYDHFADAIYIGSTSKKVFKTQHLSNGVIVDMGSKGNVVGIEILDVSKYLLPDKIIKVKGKKVAAQR